MPHILFSVMRLSIAGGPVLTSYVPPNPINGEDTHNT